MRRNVWYVTSRYGIIQNVTDERLLRRIIKQKNLSIFAQKNLIAGEMIRWVGGIECREELGAKVVFAGKDEAHLAKVKACKIRYGTHILVGTPEDAGAF